MEIERLDQPPYAAILELGRLKFFLAQGPKVVAGRPTLGSLVKGAGDPSFGVKDAVLAAQAAGYQGGSKDLHEHLKRLVKADFLSRPTGPTGKPTHGRYMLTKTYFDTLLWQQFIRRAVAERGARVLTKSGGKAFTPASGDLGMDFWSFMHLLTDLQSPEPEAKRLRGDALVLDAIEQGWAHIAKAVLAYAKRTGRTPSFDVVLRFNPPKVTHLLKMELGSPSGTPASTVGPPAPPAP